MSYNLQINNDQNSQLSVVERKKYVQELKILKYLYVQGSKTNSEICNHLKISSPSSIAILNELISKNIIEKQGRGDSIGGRKPDLYGLKETSLCVLAIEAGKYETKMALFNAIHCRITDVVSFNITLDNNVKTADRIFECAHELIKASGINPLKIMAVGMCVPGLVDSIKGINYTYMNLSDVSLKVFLEEKFNCPVFIENDAKAALLAEFRFGLAKGKKNVLSVLLDWGIGLGMLIDGKLYHGTLGFAGEFGHIPMVEDGLFCICGKQGCLETIASGAALSRLAIDGMKSGKISFLNDLSGGLPDKIEAKIIVDAANSGDQFSINILSEIGFNLGKGLSILIQLFNPELIILGGKIADAGDYITIPIQQSLNKYCLRQLKESSPVVVSEMKQNAGLIGAIAIIMENLFDHLIKSTSV